MKAFLMTALRFYRERISPQFSPRCRFIPSCSQYALTALERYGALKGSYLAAKRLLRCHPFHRRDYKVYDPVP
ncbi:MAG: membrane protein insertion efficiency factor YidD [Oscillospiraceae bacterium]|jgi:putative membrane protein insertion efficiency factor|nr:membrane protein insertion efficiency factor YidD [Oscillospiraceae bacterium]